MKKKAELPTTLSAQDICDVVGERLHAMWGLPPEFGPRFYDPAARLVAQLRSQHKLPHYTDNTTIEQRPLIFEDYRNACADIYARIPPSKTPIRQLAAQQQPPKNSP